MLDQVQSFWTIFILTAISEMVPLNPEVPLNKIQMRSRGDRNDRDHYVAYSHAVALFGSLSSNQ